MAYINCQIKVDDKIKNKFIEKCKKEKKVQAKLIRKFIIQYIEGENK